MKQIIKNIENNISKLGILALLISLGIMFSCEDNTLPETGSIADLTAPQSSFSFTQGVGPDEEWKDYTFSNQSQSSTTYSWAFGDGDTSTEIEPAHTFAGEGTYTVTLTAKDGLEVMSTSSQEITVIKPLVVVAITPEISGADFEDIAEVCGTGDSRDCWRLSGAAIHKTTSDGESDTRGVKYPSGNGDNRVTYQAFSVSPNTKYALTVRYALQADGDAIRASVIDGQLSNFSEFASATLLGQESGTTNDGKGNFNTITVSFETGANTDISILFDHDGNTKDSYLDNAAVKPE